MKINMRKEDLRAGDVVLFPPHKGDFIAQAIAFLTDGEVNHAALCYPKEKNLVVAESILKDGLVLNSFAEHIESEYPLRICRMRGDADMFPVLEAAKKYLEEVNAYPNFNLGLLGILLLFKKMAPPSWKNAVIYNFYKFVAGRLMNLVREHKYKGKHPMSCSQFVAQCFTDAGERYDLKFNRLVADFEVGITRSVDDVENVSPLDLLKQTETFPEIDMNTFSSKYWDDAEMATLTSEFIDIAAGRHIMSRAVGEEVSTQKFNQATASIALALYELHTGEPAANLEKALNYLASSTARNYFVSPQDLLVNCKESLEYIGRLSY